MNLLEQHIEEVHDVNPYEEEWAEGEWVTVDITTNCYGMKKRTRRLFEKEAWESAKEKGYFMG